MSNFYFDVKKLDWWNDLPVFHVGALQKIDGLGRPVFDGWIAIGIDATIQHGDVAVLVRETPGVPYNKWRTPKEGAGLDHCMGLTLRQAAKSPHVTNWCVYRPVGARTKSTSKYVPHKYFSSPSPLP